MNKEDPVLTHQDCPECNHKGCFSIWADGGYFCQSCGHKPKPEERRMTRGPRPYTLDSLTEESRPYRSISQKAVDKYGIKTTLDSDGKEVHRVYPYPHKNKYRKLPKDFKADGLNAGFSNNHLFGMDKFNAGSSKYITIVEGEDDAPSAYDMLGRQYPVVAIPGSSVSKDLLKNCHDYLDSFEQIVVASDGDDAGEKAATILAAAFPNKVYRVKLTTRNDPNEYLEHGEQKDFKYAWINRSKYVPEFDTSTSEQFISLLDEEDSTYVPTGIQEYDEKHLGLFRGHVTLFQAPEGTGKTELIHYLEHHFIVNHPSVPFATCHLEESKMRTALAWVSYDLQKNVTRKDLITDRKEVEESLKKLTSSEDTHLFSIGTDEDPLVLLDRIKYYVNVCGCEYVFIEPIQDLAQQYSGNESTERFLSKIAVNLARIASDLNVGIVMIGHENDEGQISDCRKLSKQASVVVRLERDISNPDEDIRNTTTLMSKKNRPSSFVGYGGQVKFDADSFTLKEVL